MRFRSLLIDYKAEAMQLMKEEKEQKQKYSKRRKRDEDDQDTSCCTEEEFSYIHRRQQRPKVIRILVDPDEESENCDDNRSEAREEPTGTPGLTTKTATIATTPSFATRVTAGSNPELPFWQSPLVASNQNRKANDDVDVVDIHKVTHRSIGTANSIKTNDAINCDEDGLVENLGCSDYNVSSTTPDLIKVIALF
jgi:hypothetical protein